MSIGHRLLNEIIEAIPAILFFIISFNLINLTERLMLRPYTLQGLSLSYGAATIGALLAGKLLIIANAFSFVNAFPHKPLIYNISWKFCFYGVLTFLGRILEDFIALIFHHSFPQTLTIIYLKLTHPIFWAVQLWLLMVFLIYIISSELRRVLGTPCLKKLFLGI